MWLVFLNFLQAPQKLISELSALRESSSKALSGLDSPAFISFIARQSAPRGSKEQEIAGYHDCNR
jgi:hypothetical protein